MRRLFACALVLTLVCMPMLAMAGEGTKTIGIIQYVQHVALDSAREGFVQALADNGFVDGQNIALDVQNAQADASNLATISDRFVANNVDLVLNCYPVSSLSLVKPPRYPFWAPPSLIMRYSVG